MKRRYPRSYRFARWCHHGIKRPLVAAKTHFAHLAFERECLDTSPVRPRARAFQEYNHYEPSHWVFLSRALRGDRIGPEQVFVDIGCGMGRVVVQAARRPFGRVVGVDIAPELIAIARHNVEVLSRRLQCRNVELVVRDALEWEIPDDATHIYLYNTVVGDAFRRLIEKVSASYDRQPRIVRILYVNPTQDLILRDSGRFRLVRRSRGLRYDRNIAIYEAVPPAGRLR